MTTTRTLVTGLLGASADFRRTWPQLVLTDLLSRGLAVLVLTPLVGLILRLFLSRTPSGVLKDEEILVFLLSPAGVTALLVVGAVGLGLLFAELGVLMVIGFAAGRDLEATYVDAIRYLIPRAQRLIDLAGRMLFRLILLTLPFAAVVAGIYAFFLREHDINFYLADRPPEFRIAVLLAGAVLVVLAILLLRQIAAWILTIPMVLFEHGEVRGVLRRSSEATAGRRSAIAAVLACWMVGVVVLSYAVSYVLTFFGDWVLPEEMGNLTVLALNLGALLLLSGAATLLINVLATTFLALLVVRLYDGMVHPGSLEPTVRFSGPLGARPSFRIPAKWVPVGLLLSVVGVGGAAYVAVKSVGAEDAAEIIAHRGASGRAPENTIAAFQRAILDRADWIELDVQENADGTVVVEHDSDFMKVAGVALKVWDATDVALAEIDIGSYFDPSFAQERVPTLRQVLDLAKGKLGVFIELKYYGHDQALESRVVEIVEEAGMTDEVVVMSLSQEGVEKIARLRPDWTYGLLTTVSVGDLTRLDLDFLAVNAAAATHTLIRRAHQRGMKVYVWTINDPVQMSLMMSRGADGLITDEPELARRVMEFREDLSPVGRWALWMAGEMGLLHGTVEISEAEDA